MGVSKVVYGGETLIDITDSTVTAETLKNGSVAYGADGNRVVGTMSSGGIPASIDYGLVTEDVEDGETEDFGGIEFMFGGMNAEKVAEYSETFTLADTSFVIGSSASTSATAIKATVANRFTSESIAIGDKDIIVVQKILVTPVHGEGATGKAQHNKYAYVYQSQIAKGRRSPTQATNYTRRTVNFGYYQCDYMNASGVQTLAQANYGFYATPTGATVASTSASSTTVRAGSPVLYYRASSTYESTTNIKLVTDCTWQWDVEVYLVEAQSSPSAGMQGFANSMIYGA